MARRRMDKRVTRPARIRINTPVVVKTTGERGIVWGFRPTNPIDNLPERYLVKLENGAEVWCKYKDFRRET